MIKRALSYTIPLIPFLVLNWLQLYYDRFFISHYYGAISLGIFSFIVIISAIHNAFTDVFENTFRPSFMHNFINAGSEPDSIRRTQNQYLLSIAFSASFILLCSLALPLITKNERYLEHAGLFFLALASTVCKGISLLFIQQLVFREKSVLLGTIVFVHFILTWLCYTHLAIQGSIDQILVINLALNFVMTGVYFKLAQMVFPVLIKASQVLIPYAYIGLLFASYLLLINGILVLTYLVILQFIILAIACLWFGKKHSLNLSNALSK
jgi:O-antigen/teichoic acid export membrane protein